MDRAGIIRLAPCKPRAPAAYTVARQIRALGLLSLSHYREAVARMCEVTADFREAVDAWLQYLSSEGRSSMTIDSYRHDLKVFQRALGSLFGRPTNTDDLSFVGQTQVDLIASVWKAEATSNSTIARRFSAIRGFARFLTAREINCARLLASEAPRAERMNSRSFSEQNTETLLEGIDTDYDWTDLRDLAIFSLQAEVALTSAEVAALNPEDLSGHFISIERTCFRPRKSPFSSRSRRAVDDYLQSTPFAVAFGGPLFVNERGARISVRTIEARFCRRARRLGITGGRGPSCLRWQLGRNLASAGHSPEEIAEALGMQPLSVGRLFSEACT